MARKKRVTTEVQRLRKRLKDMEAKVAKTMTLQGMVESTTAELSLTEAERARLEAQVKTLADRLSDRPADQLARMMISEPEDDNQLQVARGANILLSKRNRALVSQLVSTEVSRARLAGYIDRVRETDNRPEPLGVREADLVSGALGLGGPPSTEQLLAMNNKKFAQAIDGMSEEELAQVLGRPEADEDDEFGLHRPNSY